jgi:hypothetical protein
MTTPGTHLRRVIALAGRFRASSVVIRAVFEVRFLVEAFDSGFEPIGQIAVFRGRQLLSHALYAGT